MLAAEEFTNKVLQGDALAVLRTLPDASVSCCVTSHPYFGLRNYGVGGQIGLEKSPQEYVNKLIIIFRELRRVMRSDSVFWINIGDTFAANRSYQVVDNKHINVGNTMAMKIPDGLKAKDLMGIPWRVALALQADGWYLRSEIIWQKRNMLPESVRDRVTRSHETIFMLTKSPRYWYDADAIKEPCKTSADDKSAWTFGSKTAKCDSTTYSHNNKTGKSWEYSATRNKRSVWTMNTGTSAEAHFAVFPPELPRTCILASCPRYICKKCGKARERVDTGLSDCGCGAGFVPGIVLDPFAGSGTTLVEAVKLNRAYTGIELSPDYIEIINRRLARVTASASNPKPKKSVSTAPFMGGMFD